MPFFWWEEVGLKFIFIVKIQEIQEFVLECFCQLWNKCYKTFLKIDFITEWLLGACTQIYNTIRISACTCKLGYFYLKGGLL